MQIITSLTDMQALADSLRKQGKRIGFVPTMGFLHEGHLSLMRASRKGCDSTIASIFVNPAQFGPNEDLDRYPRDAEGDRRKCEQAGADILFMPSAAEMYPETPSVFVIVEGISDIFEGAIRPGHFRGVATVVAKLFNIVKPHQAFFGQKDFQQCAIIRRMVAGLDLDIAVTVLPTVREADGLAMSSRNSYLDPDQRSKATCLVRALAAGEESINKGDRDPERIKQSVRSVLVRERGVEIDYVEVVDPDSFAPLERGWSRIALLVAVRLGSTRLIDNLTIL